MNRFISLLEMILIGFCITSCNPGGGGNTTTTTARETTSTIATTTVTTISPTTTTSIGDSHLIDGDIDLPPDSPIDVAKLKVVSLVDATAPDTAGRFILNVANAAYQAIFCLDEQNRVILFAFVDAFGSSKEDRMELLQSQGISVNAQGLAEGLVRINPWMSALGPDQIRQVKDMLYQLPSFFDLVTDIAKLLVSDPHNVLNHNKYPEIFEDAAKLTELALSEFNRAPRFKAPRDYQAYPWLENGQGQEVIFFNPTCVYYGAALYSDYSDSRDTDQFEWISTVTVEDIDTSLELTLSWPPKLEIIDFEETPYNLGDGQFKIELSKGFRTNSSKDLIGWNNSSGRATILNTVKGVKMTIGLISSLKSDASPQDLNFENIGQQYLENIKNALSTGDILELIMAFATMIKENPDEIAEWLGETFKDVIKDVFIESAANVMMSYIPVLKSIDFLTKDMPFYYDLMHVPGEAIYFKTKDGEILRDTNYPPEVNIIWPTIGSYAQGEDIVFEGEAFDNEDGEVTDDLAFEWSSDLDGMLKNKRKFTADDLAKPLSVGQHKIVLAVTDSDGVFGTDQVKITIQGNQPPVVTITSPYDLDHFEEGELIKFTCKATDPELDIISDADVVWTSSLDGEIGTKLSFSTNKLSIGQHMITASATDKYGATGQASIVIYIDGPSAIELENGITVQGTVEDDQSVYYVFNVPPQATVVRITGDAEAAKKIDLYAKVGTQVTTHNFDFATQGSGSSENDPKMILLVPGSSQPLKSGQYSIIVFGNRDSDYEIKAEYLTDVPVKNIVVTFDPNPATEYVRNIMGGYFYWEAVISLSSSQGEGMTIKNWSSRYVEGDQIDHDMTKQYNHSERIDLKDWFGSRYIPSGDAIAADLRLPSENRPVGSIITESVFVGEDDSGQLVYGVGTLTLIGDPVSTNSPIISNIMGGYEGF